MSSSQRFHESQASPDGSAHGLAGSCSQAHQSLFQLPPSIWWAAVAVPHTKPPGNESMSLTLLPALGLRPGRSGLARSLAVRDARSDPRDRLGVVELGSQQPPTELPEDLDIARGQPA